MAKVRRMFHQKWRGQRITVLMSRDGLYCTICLRNLDRRIKDPVHAQYITFDHIVPRSMGGRSDLFNLRLAHRSCNERRCNDPVMPEDELNTPLEID